MTSYVLPDINEMSEIVVKLNVLSYTFIFHNQFYSVASSLKILGYGKPNSNLESHCIPYISITLHMRMRCEVLHLQRLSVHSVKTRVCFPSSYI